MTDKVDREIDRFFDAEILPLSAHSRRGNESLLATDMLDSDSSYFVRRTHTQMGKADFESGGCASPESAEADLVRACERSGAAYMVALAPHIATLARSLREVQQESSEVSEFVYAMY